MELVQSTFFIRTTPYPLQHMVFAPVYMQCLTRALHHFSNIFLRS